MKVNTNKKIVVETISEHTFLLNIEDEEKSGVSWTACDL